MSSIEDPLLFVFDDKGGEERKIKAQELFLSLFLSQFWVVWKNRNVWFGKPDVPVLTRQTTLWHPISEMHCTTRINPWISSLIRTIERIADPNF